VLANVAGLRYVAEMSATACRLRELVGAFSPEILHAHSPVLNVLPALHVGRARGLPVVYEVRASWEDAATDHGTMRLGSARYRLSRLLETHALRQAAHVTTICEGLRADIVARGIPPGKVTVIPNGVDTQSFTSSGVADRQLLHRLNLDGCVVIGFAGSFYAYEGLDLLIEAARRLIPASPRLRLLLIGGGPQQAALEAQAARSGIADRVVFVGRVAHHEMQRYYDLMDLLVYPRKSIRLTELVTPLKPLEAMAQGRIVLASDVGGHRELIRDGETGFLFPAGDANALVRLLARILAQREAWAPIRERARRFVEKERTWTGSAAAYAQVYAAVTGRRALPQAA
jgi:PEP-CTERM/exosortase A-associated glycosyltransferase